MLRSLSSRSDEPIPEGVGWIQIQLMNAIPPHSFLVMASPRRPVRVYMDGCFDVMHYGHANAMRQAKALGDVLVVGVHSDEEIARHKGPPVMNNEERCMAVRAVKWVDTVVENAPYVCTVEWLDEVGCDFVAHGEDVSLLPDGSDVYGRIKEAGRYRNIKRTEGVSTTDIVGRMLLCTKDHFRTPSAHEGIISSIGRQELVDLSGGDSVTRSPYTSISHFLPTTRKIVQFSERKQPKPNDVIVYMDGAFDLFHAGHVLALWRAKELGTYLIVGVHDDAVVNVHKGLNNPIMNVHERVLSVLACRYVDEVVIGAPWAVSAEIIDTLCISYVVHGSNPVESIVGREADAYEVPRKLGVYHEVDAGSTLHTSELISRILVNRAEFARRNRAKEEREVEYVTRNSETPQ